MNDFDFCPNCLTLTLLKAKGRSPKCVKCKTEFNNGHTARRKPPRDKTAEIHLTAEEIKRLRRH